MRKRIDADAGGRQFKSRRITTSTWEPGLDAKQLRRRRDVTELDRARCRRAGPVIATDQETLKPSCRAEPETWNGLRAKKELNS
jgi:hypothetical protein